MYYVACTYVDSVKPVAKEFKRGVPDCAGVKPTSAAGGGRPGLR